MQGRFSDARDPKPISDEGIYGYPLDPLALEVDDDDLVKTIDDRIKDIRNYYTNDFDLYDRRVKNEQYILGKQILEKEKEHLMKDYESRFQDNVLYEIESNLKPIAMSRLPDLIVTPGNDSEESRLMAQEVSKAVDTDIKSRMNRRVLGLAFKHLPIYFIGIIKARWDNEMDDYVFECIHPDLVDVDYTSPNNDADNMKVISQIVPMTVEEAIMRFPAKKEDFNKELLKDGIKIIDNEPDWKQLATIIKVREVWFKWYKKGEGKKWETIWGVLWKYHDCILKKMKNPNFDYEGEKQLFSYDEQGNKRQPNSDELTQAMMQGALLPNMQYEQIYHNYFDHPRNPFYFMGYDQWGKQPIDETSRVEQNIKNQEALDNRGKQIDETLDNKGHHIFSKESGLKASDIQEMDMNDPDQDLIVDGDVNNVHKWLEPAVPDEAQFNDMDRIRQRMHELGGDQAVNGQLQSQVATSNQIAREANFTRADDLVEDTINAAAEWMADWSLQFIKLRYTQDHFRRLLGTAGDVVFTKLNRNMIDGGMEVKIKASGTDRIQAKNNAMDLAKLEMIEPVTFMRDMGYPDYQERAEMLMTYKTDPATYMLKYVQNIQTSQEMAQALMANPEQELQPNLQAQPMQGTSMGMQNGVGSITQQQPMTPANVQPANPTPMNTAQVPTTAPQLPGGSVRNM